jgi:site-specific DNA-methyltransferase (adenine-specific)/adenine-specific DNA-methyltransferase
MEGREFLGFELNPHYVDMARERIFNVGDAARPAQADLLATLRA